MTAISNVTGEVWREISDRSSEVHRRIFDSFLTTRQILMPWTNITESAFLVGRHLTYQDL